MTPPASGPRQAAMAELIKFLLWQLPKWANMRAFGKIIITVQHGQIEFVTVDQSYTPGSLPVAAGTLGSAAGVQPT